MPRIALVGQPNCGKSTIFNHLVGYRAHTSNLSGTTVECLASQTLVAGQTAEIVDLPGTYSLVAGDAAEREARRYLEEGEVDAILNVIDASLLSRSLELTLQLLELGTPMVVCLNMADEARRKGIEIDERELEARLGVPVISTIAVRGEGIAEVARAAMRQAKSGAAPPSPVYSHDVERILASLANSVPQGLPLSMGTAPRQFLIRWLEKDPALQDGVPEGSRRTLERLEAEARSLFSARGGALEALSAERHARAMDLFEAVATVGSPEITLRDRLDRVLMHPTIGVLLFLGIMYGFFLVVFRLGSLAEAPIVHGFELATAAIERSLPAGSLGAAALQGVVHGIGGAAGIVLPYLVPFLIGLAVLEDVGYLPRAGYLLDGLMHRIGLHGKSMIPFLLGYGCSVPAILATRILESRRDRFVTAMLAVMFPCVARTTIIFGLVGYFLGPHLAFAVYVINLVVVAVVGVVMTKLMPRATPGLILEIPTYKIPSLRVMASKVWLRIRSFVRLALPILVVGSVALSVLEALDLSTYLNLGLRPITWSLGLTASVGVTLVFGVLRKELALVMLFQALGTANVSSVLSPGQMMTFTLFLVFYVPCVATIAALAKEVGRARAAVVVGVTVATALAVGLLARGILAVAA
ncbi:MAG: ferrous iron transport protein B [Candidatus Bipolaricaulota bacterium]|nr:MAG: ferrous iron transport protein B [Candidatus Bipolaricaulota bacterium]